MTDLKPLRGAAARIKFLPYTGQAVKKGLKIGEITCDQCEGSPKAYVCVGEGPHVYAFHNNHHPQSLNDDIEVPCGCTLLKLNKPLSENVLNHWKGTTDAKKTAPAPAAKKPAAAGTIAKRVDDRGGKRPAAVRPGTAAAKPGGNGSAAGGPSKRDDDDFWP